MAIERDPLATIREMHEKAGLKPKKPEPKRAPKKPRNAEEELEAIANKFTVNTVRTSDDPLEMMREMSSRFGLDTKKPAVAQKAVERNPERELQAIADRFGIGIEDLPAEEIIKISASEIISRRTQKFGKVMLATGVITLGGNGLAHAQTSAETSLSQTPPIEVAADQYAVEEPEEAIVSQPAMPQNETTVTPAPAENTEEAEATTGGFSGIKDNQEVTAPTETYNEAEQPETTETTPIPPAPEKPAEENDQENNEVLLPGPIGKIFNGGDKEAKTEPETPEPTTPAPETTPQQNNTEAGTQEQKTVTNEIEEENETQAENRELAEARQEAEQEQQEADSITIPEAETPKNNKDFAYFNQLEPEWAQYYYHGSKAVPAPGTGNLQWNGCGVFSATTATINATGKDIKAPEMANFMMENGGVDPYGGGSTYEGMRYAAEAYGANAYHMADTYDNIKAVTDAGGMVIINGTATIESTGAEVPHILTVRGVTEDGQFLLADSSSQENTFNPQDPEEFLAKSSMAIGVEPKSLVGNQDEIDQAKQAKAEAQAEANQAEARADRLQQEANTDNETEQRQQNQNEQNNPQNNSPDINADKTEENNTDVENNNPPAEQPTNPTKPNTDNQNNSFIPDFVENLVDDNEAEDKPQKSQNSASQKSANNPRNIQNDASNIDALVGIEDNNTNPPQVQTPEPSGNQNRPQTTENNVSANPTDALVGIGNTEPQFTSNPENSQKNTESEGENNADTSNIDALVGIGNAPDSATENSNNKAGEKPEEKKEEDEFLPGFIGDVLKKDGNQDSGKNESNSQASNGNNQQSQKQTQIAPAPTPSEGMPAPAQPQGQAQEYVEPAPKPKPEPQPETEPEPAPEPEPEMSEEEQEKAAIEPYEPLLNAIASPESGGNYNAYFAHADNTEIDFTSMTVGEVRAWQRNQVANGSPSSAVGKYQIMGYTLDDLSAKHGISPNAEFDEKLQDQLALSLLDEKGLTAYMNGEITDDQLLYGISQTWAGVPMGEEALKYGKDPYAGYYDGDGLNAAGGTPQEFLEPINGLK